MIHNWSYIQGNFTQWALTGYMNAMGFWFYPLMFITIVGYVYLKQQSYTAAAITILILVAVFGNILSGVPILINFLHIMTALAVTGLFLIFLTKLRR